LRSSLERTFLTVANDDNFYKKAKNTKNQVISNTGFDPPCSTNGESYRFSPLETPSALCPPQEAGFTLNQTKINTDKALTKKQVTLAI